LLFDFDIHMDEEKPTPKIDVLLHETPSATPLVVHGGQAPRNSTPHCGSRWTDYFFPLTRFWLFPLIACDQSVPLWGSVATTFCFVLLLPGFLVADILCLALLPLFAIGWVLRKLGFTARCCMGRRSSTVA
jgi:hypothetical protein